MLPVFGAGPASWAVVPSFLTQTPLSAAGLRDQLGEHPQRLDGSSTAGGGRCCSLISFINNLQTRLKPVSSSYTEGILYVSEAFSAEVIPQLLLLDQKIHLGWAEPRIVLCSLLMWAPNFHTSQCCCSGLQGQKHPQHVLVKYKNNSSANIKPINLQAHRILMRCSKVAWRLLLTRITDPKGITVFPQFGWEPAQHRLSTGTTRAACGWDTGMLPQLGGLNTWKYGSGM